MDFLESSEVRVDYFHVFVFQDFFFICAKPKPKELQYKALACALNKTILYQNISNIFHGDSA